MIQIFTDYCLLRRLGLEYMIIEPLDRDESGKFILDIISTKKLKTK